jgi:hypothetical protein
MRDVCRCRRGQVPHANDGDSPILKVSASRRDYGYRDSESLLDSPAVEESGSKDGIEAAS